MRDRDADEVVRERFVRVIGLPPVEDDEAPPVVAGSGSPAGSGGAGLLGALPVGSGSAGDGALAAGGLAAGGLAAGGLRGRLAAFDPGRRGVRALAVVALVAVAIGAGAAWFARPRPEPVAARVDAPAAASGWSASPAGSNVIVVAVAGRVHRPGLVRLPAGSRVADAIEAAGGALPGTDLSFVNLARKLVDGELVVVGVTPPPGTAGDGATAMAGPINLNSATIAQLETLPGVGPATAQRIVDYRNRHGGFKSVAELRQVDGIGDTKYAQLKDLVTV
jgi:competence protein ComEA